MGWEPVGRCIAASEQHSHTTRRLVEDSQGDKRVFTGMHEILKAKIGELEDTINVNDKALGGAMEDMSKAMEDINANGKAVSGDIDEVKGRMAAIEDDMKESNKAIESRMAAIEDDMKEIKDLLVQLVGVTRENKEE